MEPTVTQIRYMFRRNCILGSVEAKTLLTEQQHNSATYSQLALLTYLALAELVNPS